MAVIDSRDLATSLRKLLEETSRFTGIEFFAALVRAVAETLDVPIAFIGELDGANRMRSLAVWRDGAPGAPFTYELTGTPCDDVVGATTCQFGERVQQLFPADTMLVELGAQAYFGIPVASGAGTALGILVAVDRHPRDPIPDLDVLLGPFATRAGAELERLRAERALAESEERLRQIVASTMEGVWVIDAGAITTLANDQMAAFLGYTADEMLGRPMFDFMDERAQAQATVNVERRRRGIRERHEFRLRHKNGSDVWVVMATNPLTRPDGSYAGALAMVSDITERRSLELKVQHAQKLESLGVLAGGIAHDFNNLLVGILGNAGLALMQLRPESPVVPLLRDVEVAATRAADLTRQMLAYSGRGRFVIERIDLNGIIEEMTHLLSTVISKKAVLKLDLARDLPAVEVDATQIRQVVMNLVTNASDALGDQPGVIGIATGTLRATHEYLMETYLDESLPEGRYVFLEVTDTGAGMDPATRERIFDPFFTTKFAGRGLGLAATLGILRGHRGAIKVYSEPERGSSFKVLLPCPDQEERAPTPAAARSTEADGASTGLVLVADDEPIIREVARNVLEQAGFTVLTAADGAEAVSLFTAHADEIVCVLLDMTMPRLGGEEVFGAMRRLRPRVRVVLSSGYNEQEATQRFVGKGLAGFIAKPWSPEGVVEVIRRAVATR